MKNAKAQRCEDDWCLYAVQHKMEGDLANSRYWYRRADRLDHVAEEPRAELAAIQAELTTDEHGFNSTRRISNRKDAEERTVRAINS